MPVDIRRRRLRRDDDDQTTSKNNHDHSDNLENTDYSDFTTQPPSVDTDAATTLADKVTIAKVRPYPVAANNQNEFFPVTEKSGAASHTELDNQSINFDVDNSAASRSELDNQSINSDKEVHLDNTNDIIVDTIHNSTIHQNTSENFTHINSAPKITDLHQGVNHMQGGNGLSPAEGAKSPSPTTITTAATAAPTTGHSNNLSQLPQQSKTELPYLNERLAQALSQHITGEINDRPTDRFDSEKDSEKSAEFDGEKSADGEDNLESASESELISDIFSDDSVNGNVKSTSVSDSNDNFAIVKDSDFDNTIDSSVDEMSLTSDGSDVSADGFTENDEGDLDAQEREPENDYSDYADVLDLGDRGQSGKRVNNDYADYADILDFGNGQDDYMAGGERLAKMIEESQSKDILPDEEYYEYDYEDGTIKIPFNYSGLQSNGLTSMPRSWDAKVAFLEQVGMRLYMVVPAMIGGVLMGIFCWLLTILAIRSYGAMKTKIFGPSKGRQEYKLEKIEGHSLPVRGEKRRDSDRRKQRLPGGGDLFTSFSEKSPSPLAQFSPPCYIPEPDYGHENPAYESNDNATPSGVIHNDILFHQQHSDSYNDSGDDVRLSAKKPANSIDAILDEEQRKEGIVDTDLSDDLRSLKSTTSSSSGIGNSDKGSFDLSETKSGIINDIGSLEGGNELSHGHKSKDTHVSLVDIRIKEKSSVGRRNSD